MKELLLFIIHIVFVTHVHSKGSEFYEQRQKLGKTTPKVYDIGVRYLPDLSHLSWLHVLSHIVLLVLPLMFGKTIFVEFVQYYTTVFLLRYLFNSITILPKDPKCDSTSLNPINFIIGHCYDKIFSGHFSVTVLLGYILYSHRIFNLTTIVLFNLINAILILVLRSHYTIDLVVAFLVVTIVYQNKLKII